MRALLFCVNVLTGCASRFPVKIGATVRIGASVLLLLTNVLSVRAQYVPTTNQSFQLTSVYNPAFSGVDRFQDLRLGYRKQWAGFKNPPQFLNLSYTFRLTNPVDLTTNGVRSSQGQKVVVPLRTQGFMGAGVHVFNETVGPVNRIGGGVTYSFHSALSKRVRLAMGLGVFLENTSLNGDDLYWGENVDQLDPVYQSLARGALKQTQLNVRGGILLYSSSFYLGASYLPAVQTDLSKTDVEVIGQFYVGSVQAGVNLPLSPEVKLKPSVMALLLKSGSTVVDYNVKVFLRDKTWVGGTYRSSGSAAIGIGLSVSPALALGYSFEFATGKFSGFGANSQDVFLGLRINNIRKERRLLW